MPYLAQLFNVAFYSQMLYKKYFTQKSKFCHYLLTLFLFQTLMTFHQHKERIAMNLEVSSFRKKNTKSSPYNLCASFVWQTNKYLSCYSLIIFSSVSSKLLHPELLSSRIKSVSSKWFCYTGWTDSLKRSISKERFIHKWLLLSWMFMKVSIMASEHVWRYFHVAFLPFLSSGPHAISMVIEKRGQDVAQKFTFCVTELKESRIGLERQVSDDRIQIFGSFMYKMKSMCLFLVESSSITPFPLLIHDLFSILLVWTVKGYRKSVLFACLQVLFWSSLMMFIALKSCWSWRVLVLV